MKKQLFVQTCVTVFLVCLLSVIGMFVPAAALSTTGGDTYVVHPGVVFGEPEEIVYNAREDVVDYYFTVRKDPKTDLKELSQILESYGFVQIKNRKSFFGDRTIEMVLGEDKILCFWDKSEKLLTVTIDGELCTEWEKERETVYCYVAEEYPAAYLEQQIKMMQDDFGLAYDGAKDLSAGGTSHVLGRNGEVRYDWYRKGGVLLVTYQNNWTTAGTGKAEKGEQEETNTETQEKEEEIDEYSCELPDLASFLGTEYTQDEWGYTHYVTCLINRKDRDAVVEEVRDLLLEPRYQLKQISEDSDGEGTHYTYEYTGKNEDIDWVYLKAGGKYHVKLTVKSSGSSQTALILYTFPEFYMEDPGCQSAYAGSLEPESHNTDSDDGGGSSLFKDKCWSCGGDGRCNNCGGSGRYNQWAGDGYVYVRCTRCNGGSCRQCGGDGKK